MGRARAAVTIRQAREGDVLRRERPTVVAVHGLWMVGGVMAILARRIVSHGFDVRPFGYASIREGLDANAARLADFLETVQGDTLHLLGHSLGCVVIRAMLDRRAPERPGRVVCLGPPFAGSLTAERVGRLPGGAHVIGRSLRDLLARGGFRTAVAGREIGIIAGSTPVGMGRLLGAFPGPNDGMVAVEETRLEGAADHIVLPVAHTALLWSSEVARQTVWFLEHGRFRRAG